MAKHEVIVTKMNEVSGDQEGQRHKQRTQISWGKDMQHVKRCDCHLEMGALWLTQPCNVT